MYHLAICVQHSRLEPLLDQPEQTAVGDSQAEQLNQSIVTDVVKEALDVGLDLEVVPSELKLHGQFINCVVCSFLRPIPITTAQEILLVDGLQYSSDRKLQQLVFYYWYPERSKSTVRFGYVVSTYQSGSVALPLQPLDQIPDVCDQVLRILLCAHSVDAVCGVLPYIAPAVEQKILVD